MARAVPQLTRVHPSRLSSDWVPMCGSENSEDFDQETSMNQVSGRDKVYFQSRGERCAAWHYPGSNSGCVVMAGAFAVPKEPATDLFAKRFNQAGFTVLAFDYRRLGESEGHPRLVVKIQDSLEDWHAAIEFAKTLPDVDPAKVAVWAFSASGGHIFPVAARHPELAAAIAQTPLVDAPAATPGAARYSTPWAQLRLIGTALLDTAGGLIGREPILVPLIGERGTVAMLSTPDGLRGGEALHTDRYPQWQQKVAARSILSLSFYRPRRHASRVRCPLLVLVCEEDRTAPPGPAIRAAEHAPRGEVVRIPGGHYEPFMAGHDQAAELELSFLSRHLLNAAQRRVTGQLPHQRQAHEAHA
jgi:pimeloyl-ACP methyl ester carboxylesterase